MSAEEFFRNIGNVFEQAILNIDTELRKVDLEGLSNAADSTLKNAASWLGETKENLLRDHGLIVTNMVVEVSKNIRNVIEQASYNKNTELCKADQEAVSNVADLILNAVKQAGKDVNADIRKIDLENVGKAVASTLKEAKANLQREHAPMIANAICDMAHKISIAIEQIGEDAHDKLLQSNLEGVGNITDVVFQAAASWLREAETNLRADPCNTVINTAWDVAKIGLLWIPGLVWFPLLKAVGFGAVGVGAGTAAAGVQAHMLGGTIAAGSSFAFFQSAGMGGCGAAALNGVVRAAIFIIEAGKRIWTSAGQARERNETQNVEGS